MGQANQRGTYEERKARAVIINEERRVAAAKAREEEGEARWAAMTPEERAERLQARAVMASMMENGELDNLKGLLQQ